MFEEFDEDSGSDSSGSSLPGPDEFMRRARVELARRRSPTRPMTGKERFTAGGVAALMAEGAALKSESSPNHVRTKTMDSEDGDDEFQQAQSSPPRPASPSTADATLSPRQAMELMTKELAIEDAVTEGVIEHLVDDAVRDMISPTSKNPPLSPVRTRPGDPSVSVPDADSAMHDARVKLSEALHAIAESLSARHWPDLNVGALDAMTKGEPPMSPEEHMEREAAGVTGAIVNVWQACDAASAALTAALERKESGGSAMASPRSTTSSILHPVPPTSPTRGRNTPRGPGRSGNSWRRRFSPRGWSRATTPRTSCSPRRPCPRPPPGRCARVPTAANGAVATPPPPPRRPRPPACPRSTSAERRARASGAPSSRSWRRRPSRGSPRTRSARRPRAAVAVAEAGRRPRPAPGSPSSAFGDASPATKPKPLAVVRSESRSEQEWEDLTLIADYMSTTRVLSSALDVWRGWSEESKVARRAAREREMAMAVVEREIARMEFMQTCLRAWRAHCRDADRERRARYRLVSRNSIRKLTRTPSSASPKTRSPGDGRKSPSLYDLSTKAREMSAAATAKMGMTGGRVPLDVATAFHRSSVGIAPGSGSDRAASTPMERQDSIRSKSGLVDRSASSSSPFAATVESWRGDVSSIVPTPTSPPGTAGKFAVPPSLTDAIYGELPSPLDRRGRRQY